MKKAIVSILVLSLSLTSCVSKKKYADLEAKQKQTQDLLNTATMKLNSCLTEREALANQVDYLKKNNSDLINSRITSYNVCYTKLLRRKMAKALANI